MDGRQSALPWTEVRRQLLRLGLWLHYCRSCGVGSIPPRGSSCVPHSPEWVEKLWSSLRWLKWVMAVISGVGEMAKNSPYVRCWRRAIFGTGKAFCRVARVSWSWWSSVLAVLLAWRLGIASWLQVYFVCFYNLTVFGFWSTRCSSYLNSVL